MSQSDDDRTAAKQDHLRRIADAHQRCREALIRVEMGSLPPDRAYVDPGNEGPLMQAHTAVVDYWTQVQPYQDTIIEHTAVDHPTVELQRRSDEAAVETQDTTPDQEDADGRGHEDGDNGEADSDESEEGYNLWDEPLYVAAVPAADAAASTSSGSQRRSRLDDYFTTMASHHDQLEGIDFDGEPDTYDQVVVRLANLSHWRQWYRTYEKSQLVPGRGEVTRQFRKRIIIPAAAVGEVFSQVNRCLRELGILASVKERTQRTEIDEELVEEVDKWRQQKVR